MRRYVYKSVLVLLAAGALIAGEVGGVTKPSKATPGLEKLKALAGEWEAKTDEGTTTVSYKVVSAGSCLLETMNHAKNADMITVYHLDGDRLMLTHYCTLNNQPRMRADGLSAEGKKLTFKFVDATNLASPGEGHMHDLTVTFVDENHFTQEWTYYKDGKPDDTAVFRYERKK
jgi:hypothetical protein